MSRAHRTIVPACATLAALAALAPAHAQDEGEQLSFVYAPVQLVDQLDRDGLHKLYVDPELVRSPEKSPAGGILSTLADYAHDAGGCVALTADAAQAVAEEVACGGGSVQRSSNPFDGLMQPDIPQTGDLAAHDPCEFAEGCSKVWPTPTWGVILSVDSDGGLDGGAYVGGKTIIAGEVIDKYQEFTSSEQDDDFIYEIDLPIFEDAGDDGSADEAEGGEGEGEGSGIGEVVKTVVELLSELLSGGDGDAGEEAPADDGSGSEEEAPSDDPPEESTYPHPGDHGGQVPVECEDAVADRLPEWDGGNVDPSPVDGDGGPAGDVYLGCFPGASLADYIDACTADRYAYTDPTTGNSLCADGQMAIALPLITRNDLVTDPAPGEEGGGEPTGPWIP